MSEVIFINPKKEPEMYNIFQQLKEDGKAIIDNTDDENKWWCSVSKNLGRQKTASGIKLSEVKFNVGDSEQRAILPPSSNRYDKIGYVLTNKRVIVKEEGIGKFLIDLK